MKMYDFIIGIVVLIIGYVILSLASPMKYLIILLVGILLTLVYFKTKHNEDIVREELISLSDMIQDLLDNKQVSSVEVLQDDLLSKIQHQMIKFSELLIGFQDKEKNERVRLEVLISDISHQLKTPLSNLKMYQSLLQDSQENLFLDKIMKQTEKLEWLIESLMKLSRVESGCININMKENNLNLTILEAINLVHLQAENKSIVIKYNPVDLMVVHDSKWSVEAVFNVLDNAVKYSGHESEVSIEVETNEMFYAVVIKDKGIGVSSDELNSIFKRFYRGSQVHEIEGVGIGLYLAQEIMSKQGGYIYCKDIQQGSEFSINIRNSDIRI